MMQSAGVAKNNGVERNISTSSPEFSTKKKSEAKLSSSEARSLPTTTAPAPSQQYFINLTTQSRYKRVHSPITMSLLLDLLTAILYFNPYNEFKCKGS